MAVARDKRNPIQRTVEAQMKGFGTRLRMLREKRQLSQQELADLAGIHLSQLGRIERGVNVPSADTVLALVRILRVSADTLLSGQEVPQSNDLPIDNVRLFERFRALQELGHEEQETAIRVIDALIAQHRVREAVGQTP